MRYFNPNKILSFLFAAAIAMLLVAGCSSPDRAYTGDEKAEAPAPQAGEPASAPETAVGNERGRSTGTGSTVQPSIATDAPSADELEKARRQIEEIMVSGNGRAARMPAASMHPDVQGLLRGYSSAYRTMVLDANAQFELASLSTDEELWVIAKPALPDTASQATNDDRPGSGAMVARLTYAPDDDTPHVKELPLPLKHTDVRAAINGYISTVNVTQQFQNPFDEKIEAVYMFPLPEKAAVTEFLMVIGERKIRGILREKEEAEAIYREARSQGYAASLLTQHRPNVFEQKVANIEPGKSIDVDIKYFHTLAYNDGWYSFVFPTVVGPRFNPPGSKDPIKAVPSDNIEEPATGTAVRYLRPNERSAHDISINVQINAGVEIEELRSSHWIDASHQTPEKATVTLANQATIPNKDFVLEFQVAGSTVKSNMLTYVDEETQQGYFTLMMYPPARTGSLARQPMEMVFVLDCSGSMNGRPLMQAKNAVLAALSHLTEDDTFQIIRFSDNASQFGTAPVLATEANLAAARNYINRLNGSGGTMMIEGIKAALDFPHDPQRLRFVSFMTDGYIGNEADIIGAVHDRIGASRIFSFGVGSSVNRYLMERMAKEGRGAVAYLAPQDSATTVMNRFFERISHPALTDVSIDWRGMAVTDVYPAKLPDLFVGRPVVVTGKFLGPVNDIAVTGNAGGVDALVGISGSESDPANVYVPKIWARLRIAELADRQTWQADPHDELVAAIRSTALEHQLMSDYTSFVAVDSSRQTEGPHGTTVHQAVPVPDGVRYETTVQER